MIDDFAKRHLRCSYDGARIVRHDIDCKHRDEHEQRPSEAQKDLGTTSPQEVAGSTPAVASTVGGSRMPPGEWGVGPAVKQVGRKSDHSSSDFPDTAQCVVCLTTGRGREPVCGVCLQIAGDILKTTEYGLSRDATAEEVIAALHTPDVTTFGDDRRPAEATSVGQMPRARTVSQVRETSSEDPKNADVSRGAETDAPRRNDAQEIPAPNPKCGWCKGGGFCIICQARPSSPETYADDSDPRRLDATPVSNEESLRAEIRAICDVLPEGPGLLVDRVRRLVDAVRKLEDSWFEATMELASAKRELESLRRPEASPRNQVAPVIGQNPSATVGGRSVEERETKRDGTPAADASRLDDAREGPRAETPRSCRACSECEGRHHWLETLAYVCKHCELLAEACEDCDGTGAFDGDVDGEIPCETCDGDGVLVPEKRSAAATPAAVNWDDEDPGTCPMCNAPFELVRPGKSQPTCGCQS